MTRLQAAGAGVCISTGARDLSLLLNILTGSGSQPTSYLVDANSSSHSGKQPGHEADQAPPSNAEIKNEWICTSTPQWLNAV